MITKTVEIVAERHQKYIGDRLMPCDDCLDIGCGIKPQQLIVPRVFHHMADPCAGYLEIGKDARHRPGRVEVATWEESLELFKDKVDTIFLIDVIEHLEKEEGRRLLQPTFDLCTKQLVIFTPYGYVPQEALEGKDQWGLEVGGNHLLAHKSGWYPEDFSDWSTEIYIVKNCHYMDHEGNLLENPSDAFWAILNH